MIIAFFLVFLFFFLVSATNFLCYMTSDRLVGPRWLWRVTEIWVMIISPYFFLYNWDLSVENNCCSGATVFDPDNRIGIYFLIIICLFAYAYSSLRRQLAGPVVELLTNSILLLGSCLNILVAIQISTEEFSGLYMLFGNLPIAVLFTIMLMKNKLLLDQVFFSYSPGESKNRIARLSLRVLKAEAWIKYPLLTLLALPLLLVIGLLLFLLGQRPDTLVRAFTETYKHGFSQLDHLCDNVQCGGHFLCSVAAKGHRRIVKPFRYGVRNGHLIICNRQLLIANAFEELIETRFPLAHGFIRARYNSVGALIHRYYGVFNNRLVGDAVYILMKPAEWLFLIVLYSFDAKPENRIARQYMKKDGTGAASK